MEYNIGSSKLDENDFGGGSRPDRMSEHGPKLGSRVATALCQNFEKKLEAYENSINEHKAQVENKG